MSYIKVTFRTIAKMLCSALPVEGEDFGEHVNTTVEAIQQLSTEAKIALRSAYVFSRKVPRAEREDLFQELSLALLKARTKDEKLAYAIARCDWMNWWKKFKIREHYSLDSVIEDEEGNPATMAELLIGEVDFERKIDGKIDAERIWNVLPADIKPIVLKRLINQPLTKQEHNHFEYWVKSKGYQLLLA
jgi:hypothetical protein